MAQLDLKNLVIRNAGLRTRDTGYVLACEPKKQDLGIAHTIAFAWIAGQLVRDELPFNAHAVCFTPAPAESIVVLSEGGHYRILTPHNELTGNIHTAAGAAERFGGFRSLTTIANRAYAVGLEGMVYRLDDNAQWTRIDMGLPDTFDIEAIDGFSASDLYAVGYQGQVWHFDGKAWTVCRVPTRCNLNSVLCAPSGQVFACGRDGALLRREKNRWQVLPQNHLDSTLWSLAWHGNQLYASSLRGIYRLVGDSLKSVDWGNMPKPTSYRLSAAAGVLWSIGERDILAFNGRQWTRVV